MTLLEILITGVGAGIAKGMLKLWLKDQPIAQAVGSSLTDILKKKTDDVMARRSAGRQFDQIAERAAAAVMQMIESEPTEVDEQQQIVVANAAAATVNNTQFTAELLARHNLDPAELTELFLAKPGSEGGNPGLTFSPPERELYRRILGEAAQQIVDVGSQLPNFTEKTFAEVLRREDSLLQRADQIYEEIRRIRAGEQSDDVAAARFETEYRRAAVRHLDQMELFGVDLSSTTRRYRLSVAYVTLAVERAVLAGQRTEPRPGLPGFEEFEPEEFEPEEFEPEEFEDDESEGRETVSAHQALAASPRLFIRGPAGSGKTTLLQWVAVGAASRTLEDELEPLADSVPLFVKLREFAQRELPRPEDLPALVALALAGEMPDRWVHDRLRSGKAIVLIDGLDELAASRRDEVRDWLKDLVDTFPDARYVVSSRPYAAEEGWLAGQDFADAELQDMAGGDLDQFVEHWHAAVREGLQQEEGKAELDELQEHLRAVVKQNRAIRKLATSPLLCALLCALHRDRVQQLPSDRIELYRACCDMFLRRDLERRVSLDDYPQIGDRQKRALLQDFAYWLIKNGWSAVDTDRADDRLAHKLKALGQIPPETEGSDVRRLFIERSGILRHPTAETVDFPHRTFQEFLAAGAALDEGDLGVLVEHAHDDQWHETVILAAGLARPNEANAIIKDLIARGDGEGPLRHQLHLLAVACLETVLEPDDDVRRSVEQRLAEIVPPKNMTQAKALASAGDLVVPHLAYRREIDVNQTAASIRTLALIGTEAAQRALEEYATDPRLSVQKSIARTFRCAPDPQASFAALSKGATSLDLSDTAVTDLSPLAGLTGLRSLNLNRTQVTSLSPLAGLTGLHWLTIGSTQVNDISPLAGVTGLQHLYLWAAEVTDLSPLAGLTGLLSLRLGYTRVTDLSPLAGLTGLLSLNLWGTQITDLSPLAGLTGLRSLRLHGKQVTDLSPLAGLTGLQSLDLGSTKVTDLSPLVGLTGLLSLRLGYTRVTDLSPLAGLTGLQSLDLTGTKVADLSPLAGLTGLQSLNLFNTKVTDLLPLAGLTGLQSLDLWGTQVTDLSPVKGIADLKTRGP